MDDKIKYLLLAVGAYFLYDWYANRTPAAAPVAAPGGDGPGTGAGAGAGAGSPAAPYTPYTNINLPSIPVYSNIVYTPPAQSTELVSTLGRLTDDQVASKAASGDKDYIAEAVRRGIKYNFHEWNYLRAAVTGVTQPDPATWVGDPNTMVTAGEYWLIRSAALATQLVQGAIDNQGVEGLGDMGWAPILPWSTAWSA